MASNWNHSNPGILCNRLKCFWYFLSLSHLLSKEIYKWIFIVLFHFFHLYCFHMPQRKKKNFINIFHLIVWFVSVIFIVFFTWIYILIILCLQFALQLITPYMLDAKQFSLFMIVYNIYSISRAPSSTTRLTLRLFIFLYSFMQTSSYYNYIFCIYSCDVPEYIC